MRGNFTPLSVRVKGQDKVVRCHARERGLGRPGITVASVTLIVLLKDWGRKVEVLSSSGQQRRISES